MIYELSSKSDDYKSLCYVNTRDLGEIINNIKPSCGFSVKDKWKEFDVELFYEKEEGIFIDNMPIGNIMSLGGGEYALDKKAIDVLEDFLLPKGELLPVNCITNGEKYYVYNCLNIVDIIDRDKSIMAGGGNVIKKAVLKEGIDINKYPVFQISTNYIYVNKLFIERVEKNGLKGFLFIPRF